MIERVALQARARERDGDELRALGFQRWLGSWRDYRRSGGEVTVLVAADGSHAVAFGPDMDVQVERLNGQLVLAEATP